MRRNRLTIAMIVVLGIAVLVPGGYFAGSTFAATFYALNTYANTNYTTGSLTAPSSFTAAASGDSASLSWTAGANGNGQQVRGLDTGSSSTCNSSTAVTNLTPVAATSTSLTDGTTAALPYGVTAGDHYCFAAANAYGWATPVTLTSALASGTAYTSISVTSLPEPVASGDKIEVANLSGNGQAWTASAAHAASATATTISVTSASASYAFPVGSAVSDVTGWPAELNTAISNGANVTSVTLSYNEGPILNGDSLVLVNGSGAKQTFTVTGGPYAASTSSTTVSVSSTTASAAFAAGNLAYDTTGWNMGWPTDVSTAITNGAGVTSVSVGYLQGDVLSGDSLVLTNSAGASQTFTVTGGPYLPSSAATTISVSSTTASAAFAVGSIARDTTRNPAWTTSAYSSMQFGLVPTSVVITNHGTAGHIDSTDTIAITFNQNVTASVSDDICAVSSGTTLILGDTTHTTCTTYSSSDAYQIGKLVATGATFSGNGKGTIALSGSGTKTLTLTLTMSTAVTLTGTPTWVFTPGTTTGNLESTTGSIAACTNANCTPTATGSF